MPRRKAPTPKATAPAGPNARYDASGTGRRLAKWNPTTAGPNQVLTGLQKIRDRARDVTRNSWAGAASTQKWQTALVGVGITPRWKKTAIAELWAKSAPELDADEVNEIQAFFSLAVRTWLDGGEAFIRARSRDVFTSKLNVALQVQLLEGEMCPVFDADIWPGMPAGHKITQGIERNKRGGRTAYWFYKEHPHDKPFGAPGFNDLVRVPASEVSHVFEPKRAGQMRGVSELAPILLRLKDADDFEDAVLQRQKLANLFTMFITRGLPPEFDDIEFDEMTGLPKFYEDGTPLVALEPGMAQELRPGEDVKFANPPEAGTTYSDYMRTTHMGTAAGAGHTYELLSGDLKDISDRTLRIAVNEFRRFAEQRQWHVVIPKCCVPVVKWWASAAVLKGALAASDYEDAANPEWTPHGWPDIHPTQDIEGRIKARDAGFTSTSAIILAKGDDPAKVRAQQKEDEASGLTPKPPEPPQPAAPAPAPKPSPKAEQVVDMMHSMAALQMAQATQPPAPAPASSSGLETAVSQLTALVGALAAAQNDTMARLSAIAQSLAERDNVTNVAAPNVAVAAPNVSVAAPNVSVTNEVQPAPVEVTNEITNNVAAPNVSVTNEVQPAAVKVELPDREITTDLINRDDMGNLTKVIQTERTIN